MILELLAAGVSSSSSSSSAPAVAEGVGSFGFAAIDLLTPNDEPEGIAVGSFRLGAGSMPNRDDLRKQSAVRSHLIDNYGWEVDSRSLATLRS